MPVLDNYGNSYLTVRELVEQLQKCNQDAIVQHEGCDCYGACGDVEEEDIDLGNGKISGVLITRTN